MSKSRLALLPRPALILCALLSIGVTGVAGEECHPSYEGRCVPIAADVDCSNGSGDGPVYVAGPIRVVGPDVYRLDGYGDGLACES